MVDFNNVAAADVFTVWRMADGATGGVAYAPSLPSNMIWQATCQAVPSGCPFIIMLRADVPQDYETNPDFQPDWDNCDGYGGCN